jgi:hypothetical protein
MIKNIIKKYLQKYLLIGNMSNILITGVSYVLAQY